MPGDISLALVPIVLPDDAPAILHLHYQTYLSGNTMQPISSDGPVSEPAFVAQHSPYLLSRATSPDFILMKVLPRSPKQDEDHITIDESTSVLLETDATEESDNKLTGYLILRKPLPLPNPAPTESQIQDKFRAEVALMNCETEEMKELSLQMLCKAHFFHEKYMGRDFESRFWLLDGLWVDQGWQRRGIGSQLVQWGVEFAHRRWLEEKAGRDGKLDGDVDVEGIWLLSSSAGEKTYRSAGFEKIAEEKAPNHTGKQGDFVFSWYVRRF